MPFLTSHHISGTTHSKQAQKPFFQPKLTINQPGDKYEQQADAMAERVVRQSSGQTRASISGITQSLTSGVLARQCAECEKKGSVQRKAMPEEETLQTKPLMRATQNGYTATPQLATQLSRTKGGGSSLPQPTLSSMNQAFGTDFSSVRIHTGSQAQEMSRGIQAKAFTHGSDIYFNKGRYNPQSTEGKRLLGHELTHVVQQGGNIRREVIQKDDEGEKSKAESVVKQDLKKGKTKFSTDVESDVPAINNLSEVTSVESAPGEYKLEQGLRYNLGENLSFGAGIGAKETPNPGSIFPYQSSFFTVNVGHESKPFKWLSTEAKLKLSFTRDAPVAVSFDGSLIFLKGSTLSPFVDLSIDSEEGKGTLQPGLKWKMSDWLYVKGGPSVIMDSSGKTSVGGTVGLGVTIPLYRLFGRSKY